MSSHTGTSDSPAFSADAAILPTVGRRGMSPWRMAMVHAPDEQVDMARYEMETVLPYWGYRPELWTILGFTASAAARLSAAASVAHPIVEVMQSPVVVRRQSLRLSERDIVARHAFTQYLATQGIPVPTLLGRPDGITYAVAPVVPLTDPQQASGFIYMLENAIYEIQSYVPGRRFVTDGAAEDPYLDAAAQTLAALHRASFGYPGTAHRWPSERSSLAIAQVYLERINEASRTAGVSRPVAVGLRRLAREGARWSAAAAARLDAHPSLPSLHVHGDYQPHNLAFDGDHVSAIYDFDAMHWDRRIIELAYALFAFAGLRWDDDAASLATAPTPPLAERGLDLDRARAFLAAYGHIAPPRPGEAHLLGAALLLVLPVVFANGIAEDLVFVEREAYSSHSRRESRTHLDWAETFPGWIETHGAALGDAWQRGGR